MKINVLIVGNTGVGKSTLINTLLKNGKSDDSITRSIKSYESDLCPFRLYDSPGLEKNNIKKSKEIVSKELQKSDTSHKFNKLISIVKEPHEQIHVIWYCINSQVTRISDVDTQWIKELSEKLPVIICVTRSINRRKNHFFSQLEVDLPVRNLITILAQKEESDSGVISPHGLDELIEVTQELHREVKEKAINNTLQLMEKNSKLWLLDAIGKNGGVSVLQSLIPLPFLDRITAPYFQISMISEIAKSFKYPLEKNLSNKVTSIAKLAVANECADLTGYLLENTGLIQDYCEEIVNGLECLDNPITNGLRSLIGQVTDTHLSAIPIINLAKSVPKLLFTCIISIAWIEAVKEYKQKQYNGEPLPKCEERFQAKLQEIMTIVKEIIQNIQNVLSSSQVQTQA